jgi:hypothetical protein
MVRRSDGRTTVWINDRAVDDQEAAGGATVIRRVGPDGAVTLEVPQSKRRVDLKVGQSVEVLSGSIGEGSRPQPATSADKPTEPQAKNQKTRNGTTAANGERRSDDEAQGSGSRPAPVTATP